MCNCIRDKEGVFLRNTCREVYDDDNTIHKVCIAMQIPLVSPDGMSVSEVLVLEEGMSVIYDGAIHGVPIALDFSKEEEHEPEPLRTLELSGKSPIESVQNILDKLGNIYDSIDNDYIEDIMSNLNPLPEPKGDEVEMFKALSESHSYLNKGGKLH